MIPIAEVKVGSNLIQTISIMDLTGAFGTKTPTPGWSTVITAKGYKDFEFEAQTGKTYISEFNPDLALHEK